MVLNRPLFHGLAELAARRRDAVNGNHPGPVTRLESLGQAIRE